MNNKRFKIILIFFGLTFLISDIFSQKGYQLGYVHYDSTPKDNELHDFLIYNGMQGGLTYDIKLKELIYLQTAGLLSISYNSYTERFFNGTNIENYKFNTIDNSISIPVQIKFILPQTTNFNAFVFTGPTLMGSVAKFGQTINTDTNQKSSFTYYDVPFKNRFTIFWGIGIGFEYKKVYIKGNYDLGILNPYEGIRSNSFNIAIGKILK
jgi:hypothetical protein